MEKIEERYIKTIKFINMHECKCTEQELIDFLDEEEIPYMIFSNIEEIFDTYDEDDYTCISFEYCIFTNNNTIIRITD